MEIVLTILVVVLLITLPLVFMAAMVGGSFDAARRAFFARKSE